MSKNEKKTVKPKGNREHDICDLGVVVIKQTVKDCSDYPMTESHLRLFLRINHALALYEAETT